MSGTIKLRAHEVAWLLRGALAATSKDDVTPVLCAVLWSVDGGRVTVTATDRYRVHQLHSTELIGDDVTDVPAEGEFLMSRSQASLLLKSIPRREAGATVELTWVDAEPLPTGHTGRIARSYCGSIHFDIAYDGGDGDHLAHDAAQVRGKFPPIGRLFPSGTESEGDLVSVLRLQPEYLADTRWLRTGHGSLRFIVPRVPEGAKSRLVPVLVMNTEGTARALIQPFTDLHGEKEWGE